MIAKYYYDPFGRRLWKKVNGERTYFHYSEQGLIAEYDNQGDPIRFYGYKPGSSWTTDPVFLKKDEDYYFYHNDHLGIPQKLTAVNGAVVWSAKYSSFGRAYVDTESTITNNLRFPGQYFDQETGLYYNFHRYYDPEKGRYLRVDPVGFEGGINLFVYVSSNPINLSDPKGLAFGPGDEPWFSPSDDQPCDDECKEEAWSNFMDCMKSTSIAQGACLTKCSIACLPSIASVGIGYVACFKSCAIGCTVGTVPPRIICAVIWIKERRECKTNIPNE